MIKRHVDYFSCPAEIEQDMENWRRWLITGRGAKGCCRSIESRYKSTDVFNDEIGQIVQVNILDAIIIERIVCSLPRKNKDAIKFFHVKKMPDHIIKRKLREHDLGCLMRNSWNMIKNHIDKQKLRYNIHITADTVTDETNRQKAA